MEHQDLLELAEPRELMEHQDLLEHRDPRELMEHQEQVDLQDLQERVENLEPREPREPREPQVHLEREEHPALLDHPGQAEPLALAEQLLPI